MIEITNWIYPIIALLTFWAMVEFSDRYVKADYGSLQEKKYDFWSDHIFIVGILILVIVLTLDKLVF